MEIQEIVYILRRQWWLIAIVTLLAAGSSLVVALRQPAHYSATAQLLVMLADVSRVDIEDPLAYDVAAIVHGRPFANDLAAALAARGHALDANSLIAMLRASNQKRLVLLSAESTDPALPPVVLAAAAEQLQQGGLRYWGEAALRAERPGITVVILDMPSQSSQSNGPNAIIREVGLRTLAGLAVGVLLVLLKQGWQRGNEAQSRLSTHPPSTS